MEVMEGETIVTENVEVEENPTVCSVDSEKPNAG